MDNKKITINFSLESVFVVVASLLLIWFLFYVKDIVVLLVVSFILATALEPAVYFLEKRKIPRWIAAILVYILLIFIVGGLVRLVLPPTTQQIQNLFDARHEIGARIGDLFSRAPEQIKDFAQNYSSKLPEKIGEFFSSSILANVLGVFSGLLGIATVIVVSFYLLLEKNLFERTILRFWPKKSREKAVKTFQQMSFKISLWSRGQLILSASIGLLAFIGLTVLRVDYALTLALLAAFGELLPIIGFWIALIPTLLIAFAISPITGLSVLILYFAIQQFEAQILVPQVMKRAVGLSPVVIIISLLVGAKLLGILGVLIAIPIVSAGSVILDNLFPKNS